MKEISAGGIVFYEDQQEISVLLIQDRCNKWTLPKGKQEEGESFPETAIREILEETGITGEIVKPLDKVYYEYYHPNGSKVEKEVHYFLVKAKTNIISVQESEINNAVWIPLNDAWEKQRLGGYDNNIEVMKMALSELGYTQFK